MTATEPATEVLFWRSFVRFSEQLAQPVESTFPGRTAVGDPLLCHSKARGFDAACAYSARLFSLDQAAFLQHLQMLDDCGESDVERLSQARDRWGPR